MQQLGSCAREEVRAIYSGHQAVRDHTVQMRTGCVDELECLISVRSQHDLDPREEQLGHALVDVPELGLVIDEENAPARCAG